jgi:hypothetical protein
LKEGINAKKAQEASKLILTCFGLHNFFVAHDLEDGKWTESGASDSEMAADNNTLDHVGLIEKGNNSRTATVMSSSKEQQDEYRRLELALIRCISAKQKKEKNQELIALLSIHSGSSLTSSALLLLSSFA